MVVDTGAEKTFVREDLLPTRGVSSSGQQLCGVTGDCVPMRGPVWVNLTVGVVTEHLPVYVAAMEDSCLLGLDYLSRVEACVDLHSGRMSVRGHEVPLNPGGHAAAGMVEEQQGRKPPAATWRQLTRGEPVTTGSKVARTTVTATDTNTPTPTTAATTRREPNGQGEAKEESDRQKEDLPEYLKDLVKRSTAQLTADQADEVRKLLAQYADVFSSGDMDLGRTSLVQHHIYTRDSPPIKQAHRRVPPAKREEMQRAVQEMEAAGVIERSDSPWCSQVVLVTKKDKSKRFCVDYRALNAVTVTDAYPLPRIDDTLDALSGVQWFSTLDLKSGYHQVEMAPEDKKKTAFSFGQGLWHFNVMPFGLCNAPSCFERLMERVLEGMQWKAALVYLDDVLVFGNTFEEELVRLTEVLRRLRTAGLKLSPKKCTLFRTEVPFLGHLVGRQGVKTDPLKVTAVEGWPVPKTVSELRSFLGLCTYYRRFVPGFATVAAPLHNLTRKGAQYLWDEACQQAFTALKQALVKAPVLPYPDPELPYILDTDASQEGVGAVLSQLRDGQECVVAYYSAKFSKPEKNYCVTRKELVAVMKGLAHFHHYLYGSHFTIRTDHAALRWLKTLREPEGQLARWIGKLEQYNYVIEHRPGRCHNNADSLSRRPCTPECIHCSRREPEVKCRKLTVAHDTAEADDKWEKDQREDPDVSPVIRWMEAGSERPSKEAVSPESPATKCLVDQWEALRLREGILQRRWVNAKSGEAHWLVVVPVSRREELLREMHEGKTSGHVGVKRTLEKLRQRVYWVGLRQDVREWCKTCRVCAARKGPAHKTRASLQLYQAGAPMERMAVDIAGPFPCTERGNKYLCVAMDYFTKWPEVCALPNHEAETVASFLVDQVFTRFGVPGELHSDQGREFESRVFRECCRLLGIHKTRTTPLRPQSDGMVERFNATIVHQLAKYCSEDQHDWDVWVPYMLMAYRSAEHEATGFSPAKLMFGRELRLPVDLTTGRPPGTHLPDTHSDYVRALQRRLEETRHRASQHLKTAGQAMWRQYQGKTRNAEYIPGDLVWLHNPQRKPGRSPKLQSSWEGPYKIVEAVSAVTYRLDMPGRKRAGKVVHVDRLWRHPGNGVYTWGEQMDSATECSNSDSDHTDSDGDSDSDTGGEGLVAQNYHSVDGSNVDESEGGSVSECDEEKRQNVTRPRRQVSQPRWLTDYVIDI